MIRFESVYEALLAAYGPQHWWPAEDSFEIMAGALLVQRTTWPNAANALLELKQQGLLSPEALALADVEAVQKLIHSAGFFRSKAARLIGLAEFFGKAGGGKGLGAAATPELRAALLQQAGIGPETADAILLYAFQRPVVVIDEYLRRLAQRLMASRKSVPDRSLRQWIAAEISDVVRLNELHALVVAHGKDCCSRVPRCATCALRMLCRTGRRTSDT